MSALTIFFMAPAGDILTMDFSLGPSKGPSVDSKNILPDVVGDLDFLLTGERDREPISIRQEEVFAIYKVDDELVTALADLTDEQMPEVADEWGIYDLDETMSFLAELRALARECQARDEEMFLYF